MSPRVRRYPRGETCFVCGEPYQARDGRNVLCPNWQCKRERRKWTRALPEPESPGLRLAFENGRAARRSCLELSSNPFRDEDPSSQGSVFHALMRRYWRAGWRCELAEQLRSAGLSVAPGAAVVLRAPKSATILSAG